MKVTIANHSGFCYGVKRAVQMANGDFERDTFTYGPLIHNEAFQERMNAKKIYIEEDLDQIKGKNLIIRSHGVGKSVYKKAKENNITVFDATCPYVKRIHKIVENAHQEGQKIVIIGDKNHPEVNSINGWCDNEAEIIKKTNFMLNNIDIFDRITVVCQTTFKMDLYKEIKDKLLKKFEHIIIHDTICSATKNRQESATELAQSVDLMIVVGGKNSSNTNKLYELCKDITNTIFIQTYKDYNLSDLTDVNSIGIVGGASTPDWVVNNILQIINEGEGF